MSIAHVAPQGRRSVNEAAERVSAQDYRPVAVRRVGGARRNSGFTVVNGEFSESARTHLASVVQISDAPSVRQRRQVLRAEDPAVRRRPTIRLHGRPERSTVPVAEHASAALQAVRSGAAQLRVGHLLSAGAFIATVVAAAQIGLALQPAAYTGPTVEHSVRSGESVWSLAATVDTQRPLEDVVADIERLNGVSGALSVGQHVVLPTR